MRKFDVALSFAGEQREYVKVVANKLDKLGVSVFYDKNARVEMWGRNLVEFLHEVYEHNCKSCVIFVSKKYKEKFYPTIEKRSAISDEVKVLKGKILQVKFDKTNLPGIPTSDFYLKAKDFSPEDMAYMIVQKLELFFPDLDFDTKEGIVQTLLHTTLYEIKQAELHDVVNQFEVAKKLIKNNHLEDALFRVKRGLRLTLDEGILRKTGKRLTNNKTRFKSTSMLFPECYPLIRFVWEIVAAAEYERMKIDDATITQALVSGCEAVKLLSNKINLEKKLNQE